MLGRIPERSFDLASPCPRHTSRKTLKLENFDTRRKGDLHISTIIPTASVDSLRFRMEETYWTATISS